MTQRHGNCFHFLISAERHFSKKGSTKPPSATISQLLPVSTAEQARSPMTTFSSLPVEIRTSIWEFVSFLPRNLDIWSQCLGSLENDYNSRKRIFAAPFKYLTTRPVPAILQINRESRLIGLKHYSLHFGWEQKDAESGLEMKVPPRIYYNPYADRLCLMGSFIDPLEEQGSENGALPWSLYTPGIDPSSLAPVSMAVNLWPHEYGYGFDEYALEGHIPDEFGFIIGLQKVKEVILIWEAGLEIDKDNILLGARSFKLVKIETPATEEKERIARLVVGKALLEREFQERIDRLKEDLEFGYIGQAEFDKRLADLEVRPVVRFGRLMADDEFAPDPDG